MEPEDAILHSLLGAGTRYEGKLFFDGRKDDLVIGVLEHQGCAPMGLNPAAAGLQQAGDQLGLLPGADGLEADFSVFVLPLGLGKGLFPVHVISAPLSAPWRDAPGAAPVVSRK
mgnify:CR=1 FL=1